MADVGVVVVTWNSASTLEACLRSIPAGIPVVVVDNHSADDTLEVAAAARSEVRIVPLERNLGFGTACNVGARHLGTCDVLLLNPDAMLEPGALEHLAEALTRDERLGAVGPLITDPEGRLELSWGMDPTLLSEWRRRQEHANLPSRESLNPSDVDWVTGACCLVRRSAWDAIGGFDEGYFLYFEDLDLCRRLREHGFGVRFEPGAVARHVRGASAGILGGETIRRYRASQLRYYRRYAAWPSWLGLRFYLMLKFAWHALRRPRQAATSVAVIRLALSGGARPSVRPD